MDKRTLISDLRRVAKKVGDMPTREQYRKHGEHGDTTLRTHFGSWAKALRAAGVKDSMTVGPKKVVGIGDIHFPFESTYVLAVALDHIEEEQPDVIVQAGDLYDLFSYGRFPRTHNVYTPSRELEVGRDKAERFWAEARKRAPKATCYQLWGNHDDRAVKRILENSPEHLHFVEKGMNDLMTFDGVTTMPDSREELVIDDVWYIHGYRVGLGAHARYNMKKTVCAHTHFGGVLPIKLETKTIWELNLGWCGNRHAVAMSYTAQRRMSRWTTGLGQVDSLGPRFVMIDSEGREGGLEA